MSEAAHYRFPPSQAYPLNRCLYALKSDAAFIERFLADPIAATTEMGLTEGIAVGWRSTWPLSAP